MNQEIKAALLKFVDAVSSAIVRRECAKDVDFRAVESAQEALVRALNREPDLPNAEISNAPKSAE